MIPYLRSSLFLAGLASEGGRCTSAAGRIIPGTGKNVVVLMSVWGDAWDLIRKMALLEGELTEAHRAREVAEERLRCFMNSLSEGARRLVDSEAWRHEQFKELSLL
jgi:hypothetical protein